MFRVAIRHFKRLEIETCSLCKPPEQFARLASVSRSFKKHLVIRPEEISLLHHPAKHFVGQAQPRLQVE